MNFLTIRYNKCHVEVAVGVRLFSRPIWNMNGAGFFDLPANLRVNKECLDEQNTEITTVRSKRGEVALVFLKWIAVAIVRQ